jgi:hypothetical protein
VHNISYPSSAAAVVFGLAVNDQREFSEANRMVYLFELYEKYTADLFSTSKKKVFKITRHDD